MSSDEQPWLLVLGGPNGSGKSTITARLLAPRRIPVIDPDAIARNIQPDAPEMAAMAAAREAVLQQQRYLVQNASFAVETTLSGHTVLRLMEEARERGYVVELVFLGIEDVKTNIDRIAQRVAGGALRARGGCAQAVSPKHEEPGSGHRTRGPGDGVR